MVTRTISIKEIRQDISKLSREKNARYIIMNHLKPVLYCGPIDEDRLILEKFTDQIDRGLPYAQKGKVTSSGVLRRRLKL